MAEGRILYVEDNFENRILIKRVLEAEGYTVIEAENGQAGIKLAQSEHPDLVLMDINLPDIDGYECTARLRKLDGVAGIPVVALTANVLEGDRQKAMQAGCDGYIPKPIDVDELPRQVAAYLKDRAAQPAVQSEPEVPARPGPGQQPPPVGQPPLGKPSGGAPPQDVPSRDVPPEGALPKDAPAEKAPPVAVPPNGKEQPVVERKPEASAPFARPEGAADIADN